jgi:tetratricopeptide (TPR) repeat protein
MRLLRRYLRWPFALGALAFLRLAFRYATAVPNPRYHVSPVRYTTFALLYLALGTLFTTAWWTARKPSNKPNWFAVAASSIFLFFSGFLLYLMLSFANSGPGYGRTLFYNVVLLGLAIAGIVVYSRGISLGKVAADSPKPTRIQGDRTHPSIGKAISVLSYLAQLSSIRLWATYAHRHRFRYSVGLLYYAFIVVAGLLTTTIHETAHTLVAWAFKMKLLSFETGPFRWSKKQGKWSFKFTSAKILSLGGAVGIVPSNKLQPASHEIAVLAAGPISNVLLGGLTWFLAIHAASSGHIFLWKLLALTTSTSLIAAVVNILPFQISTGAYSDGARILQLLSDSPVADLHKALLAIKSTVATPTRPRDHDVELLKRAADISPDPVQTFVLRLAISAHYEDKGNIHEARNAFKAAEIFLRATNLTENPAFPVALHTALVIGNATLNHNARVTVLWWKAFAAKNPTTFSVDYYLARACYLWMDKRIDEAQVALQKAETEAATLPNAGGYNFDRDRCARLRLELDRAAAEQAAQPAPQLSPLPAPDTTASPGFRPSFLAATASNAAAEQAAAAVVATAIPVAATHHATSTNATSPQPYPNERRRWPRTQTPPGRNMWPRPMEG